MTEKPPRGAGFQAQAVRGAEAVATAPGAQDGKRVILSERRQSQKQELEAEMEFEEGVASFLSSFFHFFSFSLSLSVSCSLGSKEPLQTSGA